MGNNLKQILAEKENVEIALSNLKEYWLKSIVTFKNMEADLCLL
ncbi:MAG: hypothetical protein QME42_09260 [bacterium]|nr:hypothetical protein [bacterium]